MSNLNAHPSQVSASILVREKRGLNEKGKIKIWHEKTCDCPETHLGCINAKGWVKAQIGVWKFYYEKRDIRDKEIHPAVWPIALPKKIIELFTHEGELVVDPLAGVGTTLIAARDLNRNAVGFDLNPKYIQVCKERLAQQQVETAKTAKQIPVLANAKDISQYLKEQTVKLTVTSPPYARNLDRKRLNKSRRGNERKNKQYLKVEQYSQNKEDLGTMDLRNYIATLQEIYEGLLPLMKPRSHAVINVADIWLDGQRLPIHKEIIDALEEIGYKLKNTIIWDRTNIVNRVGIFGWPSNYITMGTTFEYILDFVPAK